MRTVFKAFLIAVTVTAFSVLAAGVASAAATASLVWVGTTGSGALGTSSINAVQGDTITLDILYTVDSAGVQAIAGTIFFDTDLGNELDLLAATEFDSKATFACTPFPTCFIFFGPELGNFNTGISGSIESTSTQRGEVQTIEQQTAGTGPQSKTIRLGQIVFSVTASVRENGQDMEFSLLSAPDGYLEKDLTFVGPSDLPNALWIPGFAAVNVPEPGTSALIGLGLLGIAYAGRRTRR